MSLTSTPAYIATVGEDHTIVLPEEIPVGARVVITVIPSTFEQLDDDARRGRFARTLAAIDAASRAEAAQPTISQAELDALVEQARTTSGSERNDRPSS
jgi:hypothetical protein